MQEIRNAQRQMMMAVLGIGAASILVSLFFGILNLALR